jgi:hypothetical protein
LLKGHKHSKETLLKIGGKSKGRVPWNKGKHDIYSEETLKAIKDARAKQVFSYESRRKRSLALKGRDTPWLNGIKQSNEVIEKRKLTLNREDVKQRMKESAKRRGNSNSVFKCSIDAIEFNSKNDAVKYAKDKFGISKYKVFKNFEDPNNLNFIQHKFQRK